MSATQQISSTTSFYDPRKMKDDGKERVSIIWTSESVDWALEMYKNGQKPGHSPFFEGNIDLRKGDIVFQYTDEEINEIVKCKRNIVYFIEKYCKVKRPDGKIGPIKLRRYQYRQIKDFLENDEIILGWSRQSGKTIGTSLFIVWCMMFNSDKQTAILANKGSTSGEVLSKIKEIYKNLPFFLKAGILGWNGGTIALDNGCKIYTGPTTSDALNGRTCNILYIDEFAYIGKGKNKIEIQKDFLANAMPVLSSQKMSGLCKLIISSTPVGKEYFYELFDNALKGKNSLKASKVCWWEIPGKDLAWAKAEISKIGPVKFKQQYEMSFNVHAKSLLNIKTMRQLSKNKILFKSDEFDVLSNYEEFLFFNPSIELTESDVFCLTVDIAEGLQQDYSIIQILRLVVNEEDNYEEKFEQIGYFASNVIPIDEFAVVTAELFSHFNPEKSKLLVESNTYGDYFFKCFDGLEEFDIPMESICKFKRNADSKTATRGLRTNSAIKKIAVSAFKKLTDSQTLRIFAEDTIKEIENFQENEKGNFCATIGHDDHVTPLINFSYWATEDALEYRSWIDEYLEELGIQRYDEDEDELDEDELSKYEDMLNR
jgi:hypothetical protein